MMTENQRFEAIGEACFGMAWRNEMARWLDVRPDTVWHWTNRGDPIPPGIWTELLVVIERRQKQLTSAKQLVGTMLR